MDFWLRSHTGPTLINICLLLPISWKHYVAMCESQAAQMPSYIQVIEKLRMWWIMQRWKRTETRFTPSAENKVERIQRTVKNRCVLHDKMHANAPLWQSQLLVCFVEVQVCYRQANCGGQLERTSNTCVHKRDGSLSIWNYVWEVLCFVLFGIYRSFFNLHVTQWDLLGPTAN